jgi:3-hydroxyacyl-[acyl-carrier-protein] dehydratase
MAADSQVNIQGIMGLLPHRYPFLLVDRVEELEPGKRGVGIKCVTATEPHLAGHFPGRPLMPGVLILEHQAQVGGCVLLAMPSDEDSLALLAGVDKARFKRQVVPGDVLRTESKLVKQKGSVGWVESVTTVDGELVCQSLMLFALERKDEREA